MFYSTTPKSNSEWDNASFWTKWTFSLASPLINKGFQTPVQFADLLSLSEHDQPEKLINTLRKNYEKSNSFFFLPRLFVALLKSHRREIGIMVFYTLIEGATKIALPLTLKSLLRALDHEDYPNEAYVLAGIISALGLVQTVIHHVLFFFSMRLGWNWKSACTGLIYDRLFQLNHSSLSKHNTGKLVNLISNDVARFEECSVFICFSWECFIELAAILIVLIYIVGWAAGLAGVGMTLIFIPIQTLLVNRFANIRVSTAAATDQRVRYISEVIDGMASVKSYGWESAFFRLISKYRAEEKRNISISQKYKAINQALYYFTPQVAAFATFAVYWGMGNTLTVPVIFSTLSLLQALRMTMSFFWTRSIETGSVAIGSASRIEKFLDFSESAKENTVTSDSADAKEDSGSASTNSTNVSGKNVAYEKIDTADTLGDIQLTSIVNVDSPIKDPSCFARIVNGSFYYLVENIEKPVLSKVNFSVNAGELVMLVGPVGSGKSSLLAAILREVNYINTPSGESPVQINKATRVAFCSQRPWILAASVRANVALAGAQSSNSELGFKSPSGIDETLYASALESCRIVDDMKNWPDYDKTEVGERGISVSGGQKARISLARAVYSDSDLYLLDDPLSAVDAHVGKALFFDCIVSQLKNKRKGVVLATHQLQYLKHADKIVVLNDQGEQTFCGTHDELQSRLSEFPELKSSDEESTAEAENAESAHAQYDPQFLTNSRSTDTEGELVKKKQIIQVEDQVNGRMSFDLLKNYLKAGGVFKGVVAFSMFIISQVLLMISEYWLRWWAGNQFGDQRDNKYIIVYAALTFACIVLGFWKSQQWFSFTLGSSSNLHENCLWAVMHTPLQFFVANPTGRILNRFSMDQNQADETMPVILYDFCQTFMFCISGIILICVSIPWLALLLPFLAYIFITIRHRYITSQREVKRIEAVTRSPIYSDFSATLEGLVTLRAYNLRESFTKLFQREIRDNGRGWFSFLMCARWLGFRLDLISAILLLFVSFIAVALKSTIDVGLIGFALTYTVALSGIFQWSVRQSVEVEVLMTAIERISSYASLPPEAGYKETLDSYKEKETSELTSDVVVAKSEAYKGRIELKDLTVTYRSDLEPVLKNLSCSFPAGAKVGICGRTGSGKSSTLLALLRLNIISSGDILVDGESLLSMSLEKARSIVTVIPQDPHLFSGTVRFNLDPFSQYTDDEVWDSLRDAHIHDFLSRDPLGLLSNVDEGGKNFSVGQRQLLSLARAILRRTPVVLMDEVTASIDYATDKLIQSTIRTSPSLKSATIITVAHRLRTIADSDVITVIHSGSLKEIGSPYELLSDDKSEFHSLAVESNEFGDLLSLAKAASESKTKE